MSAYPWIAIWVITKGNSFFHSPHFTSPPPFLSLSHCTLVLTLQFFSISFVEFRDRRDAEEAMRALVNTRVEARIIRLDWDVKEKRDGGGRGEHRNRDRREPNEDRYRPRRRSRSRSYSRSPRRRYQ